MTTDDIARAIADLLLDEQRHKTRKACAEADQAEALHDAVRREIERNDKKRGFR